LVQGIGYRKEQEVANFFFWVGCCVYVLPTLCSLVYTCLIKVLYIPCFLLFFCFNFIEEKVDGSMLPFWLFSFSPFVCNKKVIFFLPYILKLKSEGQH
jgi:hypothetical protein